MRFDRLSSKLKQYAYPVSVFLVTRAGLFLVVYVSLITIPVRIGELYWSAFPDNYIITGWFRWDSSWYADIIRFGYQNQNKILGQDTAFFPMYPLISSLFNRAIGAFYQNYDSAYLAGLIVSNLAFLAALIVLHKLLQQKYGDEVSSKTLLILSLNPFSLFYCSVYTESLFLLFIVLSFYCAEKENYLLASLWAALAGSTRFVGLVMIVPLLMLYLQQKKYQLKAVHPDVLSLLLTVSGPGLYMIYLAVQYGDPLQFIAT